MNKLLQRQIRKLLPANMAQNPDLLPFLEAVEESYQAYERDNELASRAFVISEEEYREINHQLKHEIEIKRKSVEKLKEVAGIIGGEESAGKTDDLLLIARYINQVISQRKNAEKVFTSLIANLQSGILLEDDSRRIVYCNQLFNDLFGIPVTPEDMIGADCSSSAERSKVLFRDPDQFIKGIDRNLADKKLVIGEILELTDGRIFERDFIPIIGDQAYGGHLWNYTDITAQKKAEQALKASQELWQFALEGAGDGVWEYDFETREVFFSKQYKAMLGHAEDTFENKVSEWYNRIHPDDRHIIAETDNDYDHQRISSHQREYRLLHRNGEYLWILDRGMVVSKTASGAPKRLIGTHTDITARKKGEEEYKRLSMVASANENGVVFTSPDGRIFWANEGFAKMTGYSLEEIKGQTPLGLCRGPLSDPEAVKTMVSAFRKGESFDVEGVHYRKDNTWFWGRSKGQSVKDKDGHVLQYFAMVEDNTAAREQDEKLKILSQIAEDNINAVIITDKLGCTTWINKSFSKMTGYTLEEMQGRKPGTLLQGPRTDKAASRYLSSQIKAGEPFNTEILNYKRNGQAFWVRIQGQPVFNIKGELTGYFALEENITTEREINERIKESETRLRRALEKIGDNVWELNFNTGEMYYSKPHNTLLGLDLTLEGHNTSIWWDSIHPDDLGKVRESDRRCRSGETDSHSLEYRVLRRDGGVRWVLDRGTVIEKNPHGFPIRMVGTHTDITGIKQTEMALANRVNQFKSLAENIPGIIFEYENTQEGQQVLRYISPAIEKIIGTELQDIDNYLYYIHPDDAERVIEKNLQCINTLEPFYDEIRLVLPGQEVRWYAVYSSFSYFTESGNKVFTGFVIDIDERKNAEVILEKQRLFYEDILNNIPADIAVFNNQHQYLFVNPNGIKDETLRRWIIGKRDEDYCTYRNKPMEMAQERRRTFEYVLNTKQPLEWEERLIDNLGLEKYLLRRWFPVIRSQQEVDFVIGYGLDITERKKFEQALRVNEEKYRRIIANMNLGLVEMDPFYRITYVNQTVCLMTGTPEEKLIGFDVIKWLTEEELNFIQEKIKNRRQGINEAYEFKVNLPGGARWWLVSSAPEYNDRGEFSGTIIICLDIHEQKELEKQLILSREQAERLAKTKETFLANMSHEIRTPMNALIGMSNQLAKTTLSSDQQFCLNTIQTAAENLLVIINDILDLTKIEAGKLNLESIGFDLYKVIMNSSQVFQHKAEEKGLTLVNSSFSADISPILIGDPYRINQILLNLLSNAIKFTEQGSVTVRVMLLEDKEQSQIIQISVSDTGVGMDPGYLDKLFEKFTQEYESISRKYGGTGLGMSICKDLVELMHGHIQVDSTKGKGTTVAFTVDFPKGTAADLPQKLRLEGSPAILKDKVILVVDDNDLNRLVAERVLLSYGCIILQAENGLEALNIIQGQVVDLVLMDVQMPKMNGYEATQRIRKDYNLDLPIIALTANAIKGENEKCFSAGMNDYVAKPFVEHEFIATIIRWLNRQENTEVKKQTPVTYDLTKLRDISAGDDDFMHKMLNIFLLQADETIRLLGEALQDEDQDAIQRLAHKIKPAVVQLEINPLKEHVIFLEKNTPMLTDQVQLTETVELVCTYLHEASNLIKAHELQFI